MLIENTTFMVLPATVVLRTPISPDRLGRIFTFRTTAPPASTLDKYQLYTCETMSTRQEYRHPTRWYRPTYSTMVSQFIPRVVFPTLDSLPRSYFLGHHKSGLSKMKTLLSSIDLIIECRDYRVPLTSRNPLFEASLAGRERLIVYTKRDLGSNQKKTDLQVRASRGAGPLESR